MKSSTLVTFHTNSIDMTNRVNYLSGQRYPLSISPRIRQIYPDLWGTNRDGQCILQSGTSEKTCGTNNQNVLRSSSGTYPLRNSSALMRRTEWFKDTAFFTIA